MYFMQQVLKVLQYFIYLKVHAASWAIPHFTMLRGMVYHSCVFDQTVTENICHYKPISVSIV